MEIGEPKGQKRVEKIRGERRNYNFSSYGMMITF